MGRRSLVQPPLPSQGFAAVRGVAAETADGAASASARGIAVAFVLIAGLGMAARRRPASSRCAKVGMQARGRNFLTPCKHGMKPVIHRPIARDFLADQVKMMKKKYPTPDKMEEIVKTTIYGKVQFAFSSKEFYDKIPWLPIGGNAGGGGGRGMRNQPNHIYDDTVYVRKFLEPAKFKKLEIPNWEMPEGATKVASLQELVAAGVQYGHSSGSWNPRMLKYLYSDFDGTHIFDLVQTAAMLNRACQYCFEVASKGARFHFSGTKSQASMIIQDNAIRCGATYTHRRFVGGLFTNFRMVRLGCEKLIKMQAEERQGAWARLPKETQEQNKLVVGHLNKKYKGVAKIERPPEICIIVDSVKERVCVDECTRLGIPVIGLIDSNSNPKFIDFPIAGNASGSASIDLVISKLTEAILRGKAVYEMTDPGNKPTFEPHFDPWLFSKDRMRHSRRRNKRQPWHNTVYGSYEEWMKANPMGRIPKVDEYYDIQWNLTNWL